MEEDEEIPQYAEFTSLFFKHDRFKSPRCPSMVEIYPKNKMIWSFSYLSIFLNELVDFLPDPDHAFKLVNKGSAYFHFRQKVDDPDTDDFIVSVSISN